jgi:hypothetical protein
MNPCALDVRRYISAVLLQSLCGHRRYFILVPVLGGTGWSFVSKPNYGRQEPQVSLTSLRLFWAGFTVHNPARVLLLSPDPLRTCARVHVLNTARVRDSDRRARVHAQSKCILDLSSTYAEAVRQLPPHPAVPPAPTVNPVLAQMTAPVQA